MANELFVIEFLLSILVTCWKTCLYWTKFTGTSIIKKNMQRKFDIEKKLRSTYNDYK